MSYLMLESRRSEVIYSRRDCRYETQDEQYVGICADRRLVRRVFSRCLYPDRPMGASIGNINRGLRVDALADCVDWTC